MRVIKLRVWDVSDERMYYNVTNISDVNGYIMQWTGLLDKNGREIYEGDIVTGQSFESSMLNHWKTGLLKHLDYEVEFVPEMYVIKYHEASFKTFNLKGKWVAVLNHHVSSMVEDLQVIGNIYENPELLVGDNNE